MVTYVGILLCFVKGFIVFTSLEKYMILQLVVKPPIVISLLANVIAIVACYVLIFMFNMGLMYVSLCACVRACMHACMCVCACVRGMCSRVL